MVALPMERGSAVFFHSLLPHYTPPNRTTDFRRAVTLSYMSSLSKYTTEHLRHLRTLPSGVQGSSSAQSDAQPRYFHIRGRSYEDCV